MRLINSKPIHLFKEEKLSHYNTVYHADKKILSFHCISTGAQEFTIDNVFNGTPPYFFIVGIQDRTAFGKSRDKNLHYIR